MLSERDREYILKQLKTAPDSILADAMLELNHQRDKVVAVRKLVASPDGPVFVPGAAIPIPPRFVEQKVVLGPSMTEPKPLDDIRTEIEAERAQETEVRKATRPNVDPGKPSISKIKTKTKDEILGMLKLDSQPDRNKFAEHLKLLWSRGEVKFDGKEYYL